MDPADEFPPKPLGRDPLAPVRQPEPKKPESFVSWTAWVVLLVLLAVGVAFVANSFLGGPALEPKRTAVPSPSEAPSVVNPPTQRELQAKVQAIANHTGHDGAGAYAFMTARLAETTGCTVKNKPYAVAVPIQRVAAVKATRATGSEVVTFEEKWKIDQRALRGLRKDYPDVMHAEAWAPILDKERYDLPGPGGWRVLVYVALDCGS